MALVHKGKTQAVHWYLGADGAPEVLGRIRKQTNGLFVRWEGQRDDVFERGFDPLEAVGVLLGPTSRFNSDLGERSLLASAFSELGASSDKFGQ